MDKLRNSTLEVLRPLHAQRGLNDASKMRVGFFKNVYRNVRNACFDRRLLRVISTLQIIFSVTEDECSGGQRSLK